MIFDAAFGGATGSREQAPVLGRVDFGRHGGVQLRQSRNQHFGLLGTGVVQPVGHAAELHFDKGSGSDARIKSGIEQALFGQRPKPLLKRTRGQSKRRAPTAGTGPTCCRRSLKSGLEEPRILLGDLYQSRDSGPRLLGNRTIPRLLVGLRDRRLDRLEPALHDGSMKCELVRKEVVKGPDADVGRAGDRIGIDAI